MTTPASMSELSTTAASNNPAGSDAPSTIDDQIRALAAVVRQNVTKGSDIASASAITIPASGNYFVVTGTTGITSITDTNSWYGREVVLKFSGALTITHSVNLILPGAANITTVAGDVAHFVSESSGVWRCSSYTKYSGTYAILGANTFTGIQRWAKGADVASANALTLGTDGNYFDITGTTAITSIGTLGVGTQVKLHFDGALTLTHHATDLILPGGANITTAAGDEIELVEYATGDWRMVGGVKADGTAWVASLPSGGVVQQVEATPYTTFSSTTTAIPNDDTIPQNTEGAEWATVTITPTSASNRLRIEASAGMISTSGILNVTGALFQDSTANALAAAQVVTTASGYTYPLNVTHEMAAGTTSATTFKFRMGPVSGTLYVNGVNTGRLLGGVTAIRMRVTEIKV